MVVKLVWPDGRIEEIEHAVNPTTTVIEIPHRPNTAWIAINVRFSDDVVTSIQDYSQPMHRFRRIRVGNVDTGDIHTLWVHVDTDVQVVKRVVDAVAGDMNSRRGAGS
ncbi:MAG TPA: hypothetical protein VK550_12220 [Polyangiaceae bacterium]|nr:hypothetical protein [Polyangiaceae bacterium]